MPRRARQAGDFDPFAVLRPLAINHDLLPLFDHTTLPADPAHLDHELRERVSVLIELTPSGPAWTSIAPRVHLFIKDTIGEVDARWSPPKDNPRPKYIDAFVELCKRNLRDRKQLWGESSSWEQVCKEHDYPPPIDNALVDQPFSMGDVVLSVEPAEEEDNAPASMYLAAFKLPPFKLPTSVADAQDLIVERVKLVLNWNGAFDSSAVERSSAMADVEQMIKYMFEKADPSLEEARALYAAPYTSDPVAVVHALPFYHAEWDDLGAIGYIKSVPIDKRQLDILIASSNPRTSKRAAAAKEGLFKPPPEVILDALAAANISIDDLDTTLSHGGLTTAGMAKRIENDQHSRNVKAPSMWMACVVLAQTAAAKRDPTSVGRSGVHIAPIAHVALIDPYCGGSPPAEERARLISLGEHVAASFTVGFTNTNVAKLGVRESTPLPRLESLPGLSPVALADLRALRTSLNADTPFTLAFLHQQPGVTATPDDLLTIPVVRFLDRVLEYTLGRPVRSYLSAHAAAAAHADSTGITVLHFDANSINKLRGKKYEEMVDAQGVVRNFQQHVLDGRENPSSPIILVVCTAVADDGLQLLSGSASTSTRRKFQENMKTNGLVFSPQSPQLDSYNEQTVVVSSLLGLVASFTYIVGSPALTAACIAGVAGSIDVGLLVARRLASLELKGMPVGQRLTMVDEILVTAKSKDGGLLPYSKAQLDTLKITLHSRNFDVTIETVEKGLCGEGLSVASDDLETFVQLIALGYDGTTPLEDYLARTRTDARTRSSRVALTSFDQPFVLIITKESLSSTGHSCKADIVFVRIGKDRVVRARSLGAEGKGSATLTYSHYHLEDNARKWIRKALVGKEELIAAKLRLMYSAARRDFRMVLIGSADGSILAPQQIGRLGFLSSVGDTVRLLMPQHREMDFMFPKKKGEYSRAQHLHLAHVASRIIAADMLDKIDSGKLIIELTRQMQGVDRRWTAQRIHGWVHGNIMTPGNIELQLKALQEPASQARVDELAELKAHVEKVKADLEQRRAQLVELRQLRAARGNLDPAVEELRRAIESWDAVPLEQEAS